MAVVGLSPRELELLAIALKCAKSPLDIDWDKYTAMSKYKNTNSARTAFGYLKKKLDQLGSNAAKTDDDGPKTPGRSPKTGSDDARTDTPAKTPTKKRGRAVKVEADGEATPKRPRGRKPKVEMPPSPVSPEQALDEAAVDMGAYDAE
ncbi:hypothetical protein ANO11243_075020 [Dothideomycetidae sp. 11243]|nr:hypothetical protein ANO11243_075020 [fungal sp. No.11243]